MRHPIYASIVVMFAGQGFLTGFDTRAWLISATAATYAIVQGRAETRYWRARRQASGGTRRV
jgi:protein-S-isoprenylcysteine O-methyltransferase Ste14